MAKLAGPILGWQAVKIPNRRLAQPLLRTRRGNLNLKQADAYFRLQPFGGGDCPKAGMITIMAAKNGPGLT